MYADEKLFTTSSVQCSLRADTDRWDREAENLPDGPGWSRAREIVEEYPKMRLYLMSWYLPSPPHDIPEERYRLLHKPIFFHDLDFLRPADA